MNVLDKIIEEIEHEIMTNKEIGRKQQEGMIKAIDIIHSYNMDDTEKEIRNVGINLTDEEISVLFKSLSQILSNQDEIKKHFGLNNRDSEWGYSDTYTEEYERKCYEIGDRYE